MSRDEQMDLPDYLAGGRQLLEQAAEVYGRPLAPEEYWWLGVGLAACTLAELGDKPYAVGRLEQLIERLGYKGAKGDWLQRFVEELAELDAEGLLWPVYQRSDEGPVEPVGVAVHPGFDAESGYFLALAHIAVAVAVHREQHESVQDLAGAVLALVEGSFQPEQERLILEALRPAEEDSPQ